jgi:hypothetical protein
MLCGVARIRIKAIGGGGVNDSNQTMHVDEGYGLGAVNFKIRSKPLD